MSDHIVDYPYDRDELEKIGFRMEGLAQLLYLYSISPGVENAEALQILSGVAQQAAIYIAGHVEAFP